MKKRHQRHNKNSRIIRGSGNFANIKGAPERTRYLFIYRVDKSTDDKDVEDHIRNHEFTVKSLSCISNDESKFKSFKLTVPVSEFKKLFDNTLWPNGVSVRPFVPPRNDKEEGQ